MMPALAYGTPKALPVAEPPPTEYAHLTAADQLELPERVLDKLRHFCGPENAATARSIARSLGMHGRWDDRKIRLVILELLQEKQYPIAATDDGYFWVTDEAQARRYLNDLLVRDLAIRKRYNLFRAAAAVNFNLFYDQLSLDL